MHTRTYACTHAHIHLFYSFLDFVRDYLGEPVPEPIWILLKQETVSDSDIRWAICKSAPYPSQITMPAPQHSVFYRPDALPAAQPTASKHWRQIIANAVVYAYACLLCVVGLLETLCEHIRHLHNTLSMDALDLSKMPLFSKKKVRQTIINST